MQARGAVLPVPPGHFQPESVTRSGAAKVLVLSIAGQRLEGFPFGGEEAAKFLKLIPDRQECFEDLLWVLLNSKQFKFVR